LEADLAVSALRMALLSRRPAPGLVHHSDRGIQYASHDYSRRVHFRQMTLEKGSEDI
jgi:putative transposase